MILTAHVPAPHPRPFASRLRSTPGRRSPTSFRDLRQRQQYFGGTPVVDRVREALWSADGCWLRPPFGQPSAGCLTSFGCSRCRKAACCRERPTRNHPLPKTSAWGPLTPASWLLTAVASARTPQRFAPESKVMGNRLPGGRRAGSGPSCRNHQLTAP